MGESPDGKRVAGTSGIGPWQLAFGLLGDVRGKRVLDMGAGGGYFARSLAHAGASPIGSDLQDRWQFPEIPFVIADLDEGIPFADCSFDIITIVEALNYVGSVPRCFREALRVLRPGGVMVATFPNCLCLESRIKFLLNGTYRWFPHPSFQGGSKQDYSDVGRDPIRISTAVFVAHNVGFSLETVAWGGSRISVLADVLATPLTLAARAQNRMQKARARAPDFTWRKEASIYRNVGIRCLKMPP